MSEHQLETLYTQLEQPLTNVLYRVLWDRAEVQDVIQESFVRVWNMRERVVWEQAKPLVFKIALNLAANRKRSKRLWQWVSWDEVGSEPSSPGDLDEHLDKAKQQALLQKALEQLPEKYRNAILLCAHSDLPQEDIAQVLKIASGTLASRRHKAVALVKQRLLRMEKNV